jgi:hypothetical protein
MTILNKHGAWIMVVCTSLGQVRAFATVDKATAQIREWLEKGGELRRPQDLANWESWAECLAENKPGAVDCYGSVFPVVWYDPDLDDGEFEVTDWEEWEAARGLLILEAKKHMNRRI